MEKLWRDSTRRSIFNGVRGVVYLLHLGQELETSVFVFPRLLDRSRSFERAFASLGRPDKDKNQAAISHKAELPSAEIPFLKWNETLSHFLAFLEQIVIGAWLVHNAMNYDFHEFDNLWDAIQREEPEDVRLGRVVLIGPHLIESYMGSLGSDERSKEKALQIISSVSKFAEFPMKKPGSFLMELHATRRAILTPEKARTEYQEAWLESSFLASGQYELQRPDDGWMSAEEYKRLFLKTLKSEFDFMQGNEENQKR